MIYKAAIGKLACANGLSFSEALFICPLFVHPTLLPPPPFVRVCSVFLLLSNMGVVRQKGLHAVRFNVRFAWPEEIGALHKHTMVAISNFIAEYIEMKISRLSLIIWLSSIGKHADFIKEASRPELGTCGYVAFYIMKNAIFCMFLGEFAWG